MADINSKLISYLNESKDINPEKAEKVVKGFKTLRDVAWENIEASNYAKIFDFEDGCSSITKDDFVSRIVEFNEDSEYSKCEIGDAASILFDVLNTDRNQGSYVLTESEMEVIFDKTENFVDSFSIWNSFSSVADNTDVIIEEVKKDFDFQQFIIGNVSEEHLKKEYGAAFAEKAVKAKELKEFGHNSGSNIDVVKVSSMVEDLIAGNVTFAYCQALYSDSPEMLEAISKAFEKEKEKVNIDVVTSATEDADVQENQPIDTKSPFESFDFASENLGGNNENGFSLNDVLGKSDNSESSVDSQNLGTSEQVLTSNEQVDAKSGTAATAQTEGTTEKDVVVTDTVQAEGTTEKDVVVTDAVQAEGTTEKDVIVTDGEKEKEITENAVTEEQFDSTEWQNKVQELIDDGTYENSYSAIEALLLNRDITAEQAAILQDLCFDVNQVKEEIDNYVDYSKDDVFRSPEDVIVSYVESGRLTEKQADQLRLKYVVYDYNGEATISTYMSMYSLTREDAIVKYGDKLGSPVITSATEKEYSTPKSNKEIEQVACQITDYILDQRSDSILELFENDNFTSSDIIKIIQKVEDSELLSFALLSGGNTLNKIYEIYMEAAVKEFQKGNESAIDLTCSLLESSTSGMWAGSNVQFIDKFFENVPDEMIKAVVEKYPTISEHKTLKDDLQEENYDFSEYIEKLKTLE